MSQSHTKKNRKATEALKKAKAAGATANDDIDDSFVENKKSETPKKVTRNSGHYN